MAGHDDNGAAGDTGSNQQPILRAMTFLAPSVPTEFFTLVADHLGRALECRVVLEVESRISGPMRGDADPFAEGRADIGFLCSPSYLYLRAQARPSVDLVPAGFVFRDPRHDGKPVYYSDVVVRKEHPARSFAHLAGSVWGFNDECSLSGWFAALQRLAEMNRREDFFGGRVRTGSHLASIEATLSGTVDAAAIDSTVLAWQFRARPELAGKLRRIESFGPFPIQPVVVRSNLVASWRARIAAALLAIDRDPTVAHELARFGLDRCVPIGDPAYASEARALRGLGQLPPSSADHGSWSTTCSASRACALE